jgi:hypothetical protein
MSRSVHAAPRSARASLFCLVHVCAVFVLMLVVALPFGSHALADETTSAGAARPIKPGGADSTEAASETTAEGLPSPQAPLSKEPSPPASVILPLPRTDPNRSIVEDSDIRIWPDSPIGTISYRPARGMRFGNTGLQIGGFTTVEFDRAEHQPVQLDWDSFNFLILYEPIERFRIFSEIEIGSLFSFEEGGSADFSASLNTERLFGEISLSDGFNLRFGKFQTPIGRWNLVPAEPFVWTASTPLSLDTAFDEHQTGVSLQGTFFPSAGALDYWIYGQVMDPLDPSDTPVPADRSVGGRLQLTRPRREWSIGSSLLASDRNGDWSTLVGLDAELHAGPFELLTEAVYQGGKIPDRDIASVFVQGRLQFLRGFHLITRYEFFDRLGAGHGPVHIGDLGFAWQPFDWLILKATYRVSDRETDEVRRGLSSSLSVVF